MKRIFRKLQMKPKPFYIAHTQPYINSCFVKYYQ